MTLRYAPLTAVAALGLALAGGATAQDNSTAPGVTAPAGSSYYGGASATPSDAETAPDANPPANEAAPPAAPAPEAAAEGEQPAAPAPDAEPASPDSPAADAAPAGEQPSTPAPATEPAPQAPAPADAAPEAAPADQPAAEPTPAPAAEPAPQAPAPADAAPEAVPADQPAAEPTPAPAAEPAPQAPAPADAAPAAAPADQPAAEPTPAPATEPAPQAPAPADAAPEAAPADQPAAEPAPAGAAPAQQPSGEQAAPSDAASAEPAAAEEAPAETASHAAPHIEDISFSFEGPFGRYDQFQLQRGLQVYTEVCAACHGLRYVPLRTLGDSKGPGLPEDQVRAYAANLTIIDEETQEERPRLPTDHFPTILGEGMGPDLSLMAKARASFHGPFGTGISQLFNGIGGPEYIHAILAGYDGEEKVEAGSTFYHNAAFATGWIKMPPPLTDGMVTYEDGTEATVDQMSRDVSAFLMWTAEPKMMDRKQVGMVAVLLMGLLAVLLYLTNKKLWWSVKHGRKP